MFEMAFINELISMPIDAISTRRKHAETYGTVSVFNIGDGQNLVQIDMYGSKQRQEKHRVSQSIQIDRERAIQLISIFHRAFGI